MSSDHSYNLSNAEEATCICGSRRFILERQGLFGFFPVEGRPVPFKVLACLDCDLKLTAPRPAKHIAYLTADAPDPGLGVDDSEMLIATSAYRLKKIQAFIGLPQSALEIGCSTGVLVDLLAKAGVSDSVGVELHQPSVASAVSRGRNVRGDSLQKCGFSEAKFDFVQAHHVLEHVPDLHELLDEVVKVLQTGGHCYFTVPCLDSPFARSQNWSGWFPQEHFWHFTRKTLLPILAQHGLGQFRTSRPMLTDFVQGNDLPSYLKSLARSVIRELGLGDTLEVWAVKL